MRRDFIFKLLFFFLFTVCSVANISNSHHYFGSSAWSGQQACIVCHTPHFANQTVPNSPLWNHMLSSASYQVYSSTTMDATVGQPSGMSKLCLACHDGTVAIDNFGNNTSGTRYIDYRADLGTNMSMTHPISFTYDTQLATTDGQLYDPASANSGLGGTIQKDLLFNGKLECSSCHDVHASRSNSGCTGCHSMHGYRESLSLRKSNAGSAFCLTCHKK